MNDIIYYVVSAESSKTKEEIVNQVKQILEEDISVVKVVLRVMKVVLSFMFIFVIIGSCIFVKKYSQSDEFENHYLDDKFHTLDTMRGGMCVQITTSRVGYDLRPPF